MGFWTLSCKRKKRSRKVGPKRKSSKRKRKSPKTKKSPLSRRRSRRKLKKKKPRRKSSKSSKKKKSPRKKTRFGRSVSLSQSMGNVTPYEMSTFGAYTGMGKFQMDNHLKGIDPNNRANFYTMN